MASQIQGHFDSISNAIELFLWENFIFVDRAVGTTSRGVNYIGAIDVHKQLLKKHERFLANSLGLEVAPARGT